MKLKIICIVGTRPNFIKIAPIMQEMARYKNIAPILVHTGQHYDYEMSKVFFQELSIPKPDYELGVGPGSQIRQNARTMESLELVVQKERPDLIIVVGDVNSTLAGALVAARLRIPLAHVEAGLRSFNLEMQEEVNRLLTDHVSEYLFTTEPSATKNLLKEGIPRKKIFFVGNVMIDSLLKNRNKFLKIKKYKKFNLQKRNYIVLTLHRQENVDNKQILGEILDSLVLIQEKIKIIWPVHPRTKKQLKKFKFSNRINDMKNLMPIAPLGYLEMISLMSDARLVLTDSGGIQEETTFLGVPCLTVREETERPITVELGTNKIAGLEKTQIVKESINILQGHSKKGKIPRYWDGNAAKRILKILNRHEPRKK